MRVRLTSIEPLVCSRPKTVPQLTQLFIAGQRLPPIGVIKQHGKYVDIGYLIAPIGARR